MEGGWSGEEAETPNVKLHSKPVRVSSFGIVSYKPFHFFHYLYFVSYVLCKERRVRKEEKTGSVRLVTCYRFSSYVYDGV